MAGDNPTVAAANADTGVAPLNAQPKEAQPPQHDPVVSDPTIDQIPSALSGFSSPLQPFVLPLESAFGNKRNNQSVDATNFLDDHEFEKIVRKGLYPEGPVRAEQIQVKDLKGHNQVVGAVQGLGQLKVYKVVRGQSKAELFITALDVDQERLVGVRVPEEA